MFLYNIFLLVLKLHTERGCLVLCLSLLNLRFSFTYLLLSSVSSFCSHKGRIIETSPRSSSRHGSRSRSPKRRCVLLFFSSIFLVACRVCWGRWGVLVTATLSRELWNYHFIIVFYATSWKWSMSWLLTAHDNLNVIIT